MEAVLPVAHGAPTPLGDDPDGNGTLLGRPIHEVDLTAGSLYFGDLGQAYTIGRREGITVEASRDMLFDTRRTMFLIRQRLAGNNIDTTAGVHAVAIASATTL